MIFEIWTVEIYHMKRSVHLQKCQSIIISLKIQQINIIMKQNTILFSNISIWISFRNQISRNNENQKISNQEKPIDYNYFQSNVSIGQKPCFCKKKRKLRLRSSLCSTDLPPFNMNSLFIFKVCQLTIKHSISKGFQQNLQIQNPMPFLSFMVLTIITPYKSYDMVQKNFNYDAVILTTVLITLTIQVSQKLIKSSKQVKQFKVN